MACLSRRPLCKTLQNPTRLRHRRFPFTARGVGGLPLRRPPSACGHIRPRVSLSTSSPARFVLNADVSPAEYQKQQRFPLLPMIYCCSTTFRKNWLSLLFLIVPSLIFVAILSICSEVRTSSLFPDINEVSFLL